MLQRYTTEWLPLRHGTCFNSTMPKQSPPLPSVVLAERLLAFRNRHGWSQADLAARMSECGYSWDRTTVAKIERAQNARQVNVDELVSLAWVLGVSPPALLTPPGSDDFVALTPNTEVSSNSHSTVVWHWMTGNDPYVARDADEVSDDDMRFYFESVPDHVVMSERKMPGLQLVISMLTLLQVMGSAPFADATKNAARVDEAIEVLGMVRRHIEMSNRSES